MKPGRHMATAALALFACGEASAPTVASVAGSYAATEFTVAEAGGAAVDYLDLGATITLTLSADGSTSGQLFVPDGGEGGGDFVASLLGTWALAGNVVSLAHEADTFLRDMTFTVDGGDLVGSATFSGATITVRLTS